MHKPKFVQEKETKNSRGFWEKRKTDHPFSVERPDLVLVNINKKNCQLMNFVVIADHKVKLEESKKLDKCLDLTKGKKYRPWRS